MNARRHVLKTNAGNVAVVSYFLGVQFHKRGSPAWIDYILGRVGWYIKDKEYFDTVEYCKACKYNRQTTTMWILKYGHTLLKKLNEV